MLIDGSSDGRRQARRSWSHGVLGLQSQSTTNQVAKIIEICHNSGGRNFEIKVFLLRAVRERPAPGLCPWLVDAVYMFTWHSTCAYVCACACVSKLPLFIRRLVLLGQDSQE